MTFITALITSSHTLKGSVLGSNNMTSMQLTRENIAMATGHLDLVIYIHLNTKGLKEDETFISEFLLPYCPPESYLGVHGTF